jgi:primosomal protein N'
MKAFKHFSFIILIHGFCLLSLFHGKNGFYSNQYLEKKREIYNIQNKILYLAQQKINMKKIQLKQNQETYLESQKTKRFFFTKFIPGTGLISGIFLGAAKWLKIKTKPKTNIVINPITFNQRLYESFLIDKDKDNNTTSSSASSKKITSVPASKFIQFTKQIENNEKFEEPISIIEASKSLKSIQSAIVDNIAETFTAFNPSLLAGLTSAAKGSL